MQASEILIELKTLDELYEIDELDEPQGLAATSRPSHAVNPEIEKPFVSFQTKKEVEKLFGIACLHSNLSTAQMLFETGQVEPAIVIREALRQWTSNAAVKNSSDAWKGMMRWLLMVIVKQETEQLGTCFEKGWREMTTAWARGEFN